MQFDQKRILVTGGSGALGSLITRRLLDEGARVTVLDRVAPKIDGADYIEADLSSPQGVDAAAEAVEALFWDVLVNLAGIQAFGPLEQQTAPSVHATYMINLVAPARLAQAVLGRMKARGHGRIVNVGSIFGSINFAHFATYSSSKAGLQGLSEALRRELTGTGVGVTYVAPRAVRTPLNTPLVLRYAEITGMTMDEPGRIADRIVEAIRRERNEVYLGFPESFFVRLNAAFPRLVDRALRAKDLKARPLFTPDS